MHADNCGIELKWVGLVVPAVDDTVVDETVVDVLVPVVDDAVVVVSVPVVDDAVVLDADAVEVVLGGSLGGVVVAVTEVVDPMGFVSRDAVVLYV